MKTANKVLMGMPAIISKYDPDAVSLFARITSQPSAERKDLISQTIAGLKIAGAWDRGDFCHVPAAHDLQTSLLCWNDPTKDLTAVGTPTFTADRGWLGNGVDGHLLIPVAYNLLVKFKQDDATAAVWETLNVQEDTYSLGSGTTNLRLSGRLLSGNGAYRLNSASVAALVSADSRGLLSMSRIDAANVTRYKNGGSKSVSAAVSAALGGNSLYYLRSGASYSNRRIGFGYMGSNWVDQVHADVYSVMLTYMQAVGAA